MLIALLANVLLSASELPTGPEPAPVAASYFPDRLYAFVWRNWQLVPVDRMAKVVGATRDDILRLGKSMGLADPPAITPNQQRRSYITVIRRNWHLLPYEQLLDLLGWTPEHLGFTLREDDFLFIKLGQLKPKCDPIRYAEPDAAAQARAKAIAQTLSEEFHGQPVGTIADPLFSFVDELSAPPAAADVAPNGENRFTPRFCSSYFALYGDPLLETEADPFPDGYLARLAASGVNGVWMQAVLYKLAPFPWEPSKSDRYEERLANLRTLVERARKHGIGIYLYLNEPRAMPLSFYDTHPDLKGVADGDYAAFCSSHPDVQAYIRDSIASVCKAVPDVAGFFTISASENLTNCWSHYHGDRCPLCSKRNPAEVIAELHRNICEGIDRSGSKARLIAWDWGWKDEWVEPLVKALPEQVALQSVSEWNIPIKRGGIDSVVGEYSISTVGPGPRATRNWDIARKRGLKVLAKIQAGNTWELSAVPYIPAVENVAKHIANLRDAHVDGIMLGWSLGGYPSPNLEVAARMGSSDAPSVDKALREVAARRFGSGMAESVAQAWHTMSVAFGEFPYNIGVVYTAPLQMGPANPLWEKPTGYSASMVGFPYDDLDAWRSVYPPEVFASQLEKVADGFDEGAKRLAMALGTQSLVTDPAAPNALQAEARVAQAAAIHFRSVADQTRFVAARNALTDPKLQNADKAALVDSIEKALRTELDLARRMYELQSSDSRIGFESSNQYYYVPLDLAEKVLNCRDLMDRWLPELKKSIKP